MDPTKLAQLALPLPVRTALASHTVDFLGRSFAADALDIDEDSPDAPVGGEFEEAVDPSSRARWPWLALGLVTMAAALGGIVV